jgi:hypothetical protein
MMPTSGTTFKPVLPQEELAFLLSGYLVKA